MRTVRYMTAFPALVFVVLLLACKSYALSGRAVSLKALESAVKSGDAAQAQQLCGITRLSGYIIDKKNHDVILLGKTDPDYPALCLDDFVVALRNTRLVYATHKGNTYYYSAPGCSIDPSPKYLRELERVEDKLSSASGVDKKRQVLDQWHSTGGQSQEVKVFGVPFDTRFARVMVDADYYMKRLVDGSITVGINGFTSLLDMAADIAKSEMDSGKPVSIPASSMNRFWFCPGNCTYKEDGGAILLDDCSVKLLTEQEFLTKEGQIAGSGQSDPLAQKFAENLTARYEDIAGVKPIYKELEGLFRFMAVAVLLNEKTLSSAGVDADYLINGYKIKSVPVDRTLPGLTNVRELVSGKDTPDGRVTTHLWHMTCGGVNMDVHPKRVKTVSPAKVSRNVVPSEKSDSDLRKKILSSRKSKSSLYWDFSD